MPPNRAARVILKLRIHCLRTRITATIPFAAFKANCPEGHRRAGRLVELHPGGKVSYEGRSPKVGDDMLEPPF